VKLLRADVRDRNWAVPPCDLIVDAAAEPSVLAGGDGRGVEYVVDTNLGGTINVLEAARKWGAAVLFLSSSRVYPVASLRQIALQTAPQRFELAPVQPLPGVSPAGISEEFPLQGARTIYGATKFASEIMAGEYAAQFGLRVLINRCGVLAGPWQMGRVDQGVVALWVAAHVYGASLRYIGYEGRQVRDALHVEDLADLLLLQLNNMEAWGGDVYNIGGGREISFSLRELTALVSRATERVLDIPADARTRDGDVPLYITDSSRAMREFGWKPRHSMAGIVDDTARWMAAAKEELRYVFS
jgi:CDP-paratose 2-epimerase